MRTGDAVSPADAPRDYGSVRRSMREPTSFRQAAFCLLAGRVKFPLRRPSGLSQLLSGSLLIRSTVSTFARFNLARSLAGSPIGNVCPRLLDTTGSVVVHDNVCPANGMDTATYAFPGLTFVDAARTAARRLSMNKKRRKRDARLRPSRVQACGELFCWSTPGEGLSGPALARLPLQRSLT